MSKKPLYTLTLCLLYHLSAGQFPVSPFNVYNFIKENSIYRKKANWEAIDKAFETDLKNSTSDLDTIHCFVRVLKELNDVHSQLFYNGKSYGHYPEFDDTTFARLRELNEKVIQTTNNLQTSIIENRFAYIRVPTVSVNNESEINRYAQILCDSILHLSSFKPEGFIIDLRLNGGGNIYPMLSGLGNLLGDQTICYEVDANSKIEREWKIKDSNFIIGGYQATSVKCGKIKGLNKIPVAILTGPVTRSAGSMVAIAFRGRKKSVIIGESTASGYNTSNNYFTFAPNLMLNFATHFVADRNKITYKNSVEPEISVYNGDDFENLLNDQKIIAAIEWLENK